MNAEHIDPVDVFDNLGWPTGDAPVDLDTDATAAAILHRVLHEQRNVIPLAGRRRRRLGLIVGSAVLIGTAGTVAAAVLLDRSPDDSRSVACWSTATDPPAQQDVVAWDGRQDPTTLCGGAGEAKAACVTATGITAVIPGAASTCAEIGLAAFAPSEPASPNDRVVALDELLGEQLNATTCRSADDASATVQRLLDQVGLDDWTIETIGQFSADEPCATAALDPSTRSVYLAAVPPST